MIAAARTIFARSGYARTTLEEVAEAAEFGKGTIYNYFPTKDALFASVLEESFRGFNTIFAETLGSDLPFRSKIRLCAERSLRHAFSNPEGIALMIREGHYLRHDNPLMQLHPQLVNALADTIAAEQQRSGRAIDAPADRIAPLLMNMVMGQFINRLQLCFRDVALDAEEQGPTEDAPEAAADRVFARLSEGDIEESVAEATDLVCGIFLDGFYSRTEKGDALANKEQA